jgi:hypothetical protein
MDPTQPAPDPEALQMLMALMRGGNGQQTGQANAMSAQANPYNNPLLQQQPNQMNQQAAPMPQNPLLNGMNASLGGTTGASLATPQDQAMMAMFQQAPQ